MRNPAILWRNTIVTAMAIVASVLCAVLGQKEVALALVTFVAGLWVHSGRARSAVVLIAAFLGTTNAWGGTLTDRLELTPHSAPVCTPGRACIYALDADGLLYTKDANELILKAHSAQSFRVSSNCSSLSSPQNGDVCYDSSLPAFRYYSGGWTSGVADASLYVLKTRQVLTTSPLSGGSNLGGDVTISLGLSAAFNNAGGVLNHTAATLVYAAPTGGGTGALGAATVYLTAPGQTASGTERFLAKATRSGNLGHLYCDLGTAPGGTDTVVITARIAGSDSSLTCTITGTGTSCNDNHLPGVTAGQRLSLKAVSSAGTAADLTCSFEVTN